MYQKVLLTAAGLVVACGLGFLAYAWHPAIDPVAPPPPSSFPRDQVERGARVAASGYCAECHTRQDLGGGPAMAGDYAMATPFGTIFSTNITPDPETGIGRWSLSAFERAMRQGVARDGANLFPAFPYDHFTRMSDGDIADLYAFLMSQQPVPMRKRENTVPFPLNIRLLQAGWKLLFFSPGRYEPDPTKDEMWNRGAYLAEGVAHCGACHTPRNAVGAELKASAPYAGAAVDDWFAPPLNASNPSPAAWTEDEYYTYLRNGASTLHGGANGPMSPVIHGGLSALPDADIRAIAHYFASVARGAERGGQNPAAIQGAMARSGTDLTGGPVDPDAQLYQSACAACHFNGATPALGRPELALNSALWLAEPTNLFQVVLRGVGAAEAQPGIAMPSFYNTLNDADLARLAAYLRRTRTTLPPWTELEKKAAEVRRTIPLPPVASSR